MKIVISEEEWYPVFNFVDDPADLAMEMYENCVRIDVPPETAERWTRVFAEFEALQKELAALDKANP